MMTRYISSVVLLSMLSGCLSIAHADSIDDTNRMIDASNKDRLVAFGQAMAACEEKTGCLVAVSMAYAGNMGQQNFLRPETYLDYIREARNWLVPLNLIFGGSGDGDRGVNSIRGDGNVIMVGNKSEANGASSISQPVDTNYSKTYEQLNRNYTGMQPISDNGLGLNEVK
jgi:hypothetical protein